MLPNLLSGRDAGRSYLLDGTDLFGSPTSTMMRSDILRSKEPFYDENSIVPDADANLKTLQDSDFGFVHQVLTFTRRSNDSVMSALSELHYWELLQMVLLDRFGSYYLDADEYEKRVRQLESNYRKAVGESMLRGRAKAFWEFHRRALLSIGKDPNGFFVSQCILSAAAELAFNPKQTLDRLRHLRPGSVKRDFRILKDYYGD